MMNISDSFDIAIKSLSSNKLRSFLTTLGIVIGIFAVITLVSIGEAGKAFIHFQISQWGTGTTYMEIHSGKKSEEGMSRFLGMLESNLSEEDIKAISKSPYVKYAVGHILRKATIKYGRKTYETPLLGGTSYTYVEAFSHKVASGRFFSRQEEELSKKVCVLGPAVVKELFHGFSPIGERVKINGVRFTVIGVMEEKGSMFGFNLDEYCFIPITTAQRLFNTKKIIEIGVTAVDEKSVPLAIKDIKRILIERHGEEDFRIDTLTESLEVLNTILGVLTSIIGGIAAISLLVGGIGIMNIMLVSVTERTREIGIRKAIGATNRDIFLQFLVESIVVSLVGGIVGILLGVIVSLIIMKFIGVPLIVATWAAVLAFFVSVVVGIVSGLYPSMRAASLNPIDALRYE